jgi:hypothetical protein
MKAILALVSTLLTAQTPQEASPVLTPAPPPDFRPHVFTAYGAVLLLLFLFTLWSNLELRSVERKLSRLLEREGGDRPA